MKSLAVDPGLRQDAGVLNPTVHVWVMGEPWPEQEISGPEWEPGVFGFLTEGFLASVQAEMARGHTVPTSVVELDIPDSLEVRVEALSGHRPSQPQKIAA